MKINKLKTAVLSISILIFSFNFIPVLAQQMLIQIVGGGYRLDGPATIDFPSQTASITDQKTSEKSIREIEEDKNYLLITDQNGSTEFEIQISTSSPLKNEEGNKIELTNFLVKNISDGGNDIDTIHGESNGLTLNPNLNDYFEDPILKTTPNDLSSTKVLATGSGNSPGQWKIYPSFKLEIPAGTPLGTYETTITFTII